MGSVGLGDIFELDNRRFDLIDTDRLLVGGHRNVGNQIQYAFNGFDDLRENRGHFL